MTPARRVQLQNEELVGFWTAVLDPSGIGLAAALASELAAFSHESIDVVLFRMRTAQEAFNEHWRRSQVNVTDADSVAAFYRDQFVEAYELANWHAGGSGPLPLNYARAAHLARTFGWRRALDFGSGIGSGALCLSAAGCTVDCADVARQLLAFAHYRLARRGIAGSTIDLSAGMRPKTRYYDVVTCFDVLEHVPDQFAKLSELETYLRPGGVLLVNLMADSTAGNHAMHISSAGDRLSLIRRTGLIPEWGLFDGDMQALKKTRLARVRNLIGSVIDRLQAASRDGAGRMPSPQGS